MADRAERAFRAIEKVARDPSRHGGAGCGGGEGRQGAGAPGLGADQTYLVPYRGLLRGPGVLMDRLGNSLTAPCSSRGS